MRMFVVLCERVVRLVEGGEERQDMLRNCQVKSTYDWRLHQPGLEAGPGRARLHTNNQGGWPGQPGQPGEQRNLFSLIISYYRDSVVGRERQRRGKYKNVFE